jgi:hypothetical protein
MKGMSGEKCLGQKARGLRARTPRERTRTAFKEKKKTKGGWCLGSIGGKKG